MKGCPLNNFDLCKESDCSFFLPDDEAIKVLALLDSDLAELPARSDTRCIIWLNFLATQETFAANDAASRFVAYKPGLQPFADHPWTLLYRLLSDIQQKLEFLEKELKKS